MLLQRFASGITNQLFRRAAAYSTSTARPNVAVATQLGSSAAADPNDAPADPKKPKSPLVAAAFENLKNNDTTGEAVHAKSSGSQTSGAHAKAAAMNIDERIINAKTVNGLLAVSESNGPISRKHALKIVSILAEWSTMNRAKISEFENDSRFLRICRVLGRNVPKHMNGSAGSSGATESGTKRIGGFRTDDLNTVLGVAGDDEAAKLIASISLPQMVKVMSTLAQRKRRSTPLLRSLAFNISSSTEPLDLKQAADILYAMATLNFQDSVLAAKICADIQAGLPKNTDKSAVVGSILTSLGILKYRDLDILEALTQWNLKNADICRPQDLSALFYTSSVLNFKSSSIEEVRSKLAVTIVKEDCTKPNEWLNHVWSLAMMRLVTNKQLETVLSAQFLEEMQAQKQGLTPTSKMKLLNLNSYAQLIAQQYMGPLLAPESVVFEVPMAHAKSKQVLLNGMLDALKSLLPASNHVNSLVDSKMGFIIDALCTFDEKRNPLPLDKDHPNAIKVVLMVIDFHDVCHGPHRSASGTTILCFDLLEKSGYKVIPVPYNEFNTSDKLLKRVQYLEGKFKMAISSSAH